jgi:transcriptional regulator with XRE-family HTH domain
MMLPPEIDLKALRSELRLTDERLAERLGIGYVLLRSWLNNGAASSTAVKYLKLVIPGVRAERLAELAADAEHRAAAAGDEEAPLAQQKAAERLADELADEALEEERTRAVGGSE